MSILKVLRFPNPKLRNKANPVLPFTDIEKNIVSNMFETMYLANGVGLAAVQVGIPLRIVVTDCSKKDEKPSPIAFVNPEIIKKSEEVTISEEGCLSVPEIYADVERSDFVTIKALDENGKAFEMECEGLLAICIQHEIDHLDGKLFIDYLSPAKRNLIRGKMKKYEKRLIKEAKEDAKEEAKKTKGQK